ncbi:MAG TPA: alkene reductase [bacterium]|jgi:N-ethylmaleimide reductase|nr:alkene reductase [bacterium]
MPTIFEPYALGPITLSNRLVMNPMTRSRSDAEGLANALMAEYYGQRAASAGLIVTEGTAPHPNGKGYARIPGLWNQAQAESWKPVTAAVHAKGGRIFAQLMHTGRVTHPANLPAGARVVAPSAVAAPGQMYTDSLGLQDFPVPEALDEPGVHEAITSYALAARNAVAAGFDGVELHAANGYLLEQFLSPHSNQRQDAWGGSVDKRIRFVVEAAREAAKAIGGDKVGIRLSPYGANGGMLPYPEVDETYLKLADQLAAAGLIYIHIANHSALGAPAVPESLLLALRKAWPRTLLWGGSLDQASAEAALREGKADLVGVGRALLANPDLKTRWQKGLPLNQPDFATFYTPGPKGYTDYPAAEGVAA